MSIRCDITLHCTAAAAAVITNNIIILIVVVGLIDSIYITQLTLEYKNGNNKIHERIAHGRAIGRHTHGGLLTQIMSTNHHNPRTIIDRLSWYGWYDYRDIIGASLIIDI